MIAGFKIGEVNKKETTPEKGAPLLIKPINTGIVEQEQNGVTEPKSAPKKLFKTGRFVVRVVCIVSLEM